MTKFIVYRAAVAAFMRARVIARHRNGDVTVEPWFWQDGAGNDIGAFQGGYKVRVPAHCAVAQ